MKAFIIMGRTLKAAYEDLFLCVFMSLAWWAGPLIGTFVAWLLQLSVLPNVSADALLAVGFVLGAFVTVPSTTAAIHHVTNRLANYKRADNSFFWEALRLYTGRVWLLFVLSLIIPVAILFNIWFYFNSQGWLPIIGVAWLWLLLLSFMVNQYFFPLFWQQDEPNIRLILRNSLLLAVRHPLYSILLLLFQLLLLVVSIGLTLPLILLAPALLPMAANFGLAGLLQEMGLAPEPPEAPAPGR